MDDQTPNDSGSNRGGTQASTQLPTREQIAKWSVAKMRKWLLDHHLPVSGKGKDELFAAIIQNLHASSQPQSTSQPASSNSPQVGWPTLQDAMEMRRDVEAFSRTVTTLLSQNEVKKCAAWVHAVRDGDDQGATFRDAVSRGSSSVCGHHLSHSEIAYKCLACSSDPTCIFCADCFKRSPCANHEYRIVRSAGGICDCGDPQAWKPESFCSAHCGQKLADPTVTIPPVHKRWIVAVTSSTCELLAKACQLVAAASPTKPDPATAETSELIGVLSQALIALCRVGDCAKRLVSCGLTDKSPSGKSPMEILFTVDSSEAPPLAQMRRVVEECITDTHFRVCWCRAYAKVIEEQTERSLIAPPGALSRRLDSFAVQVLTSRSVVEELMNPQALEPDVVGSTSTLAHRILSSIIYGLSCGGTTEGDPKLAGSPSRLFNIAASSTTYPNFSTRFCLAYYHLKYIFLASNEVPRFVMTSATLSMGFLAVLQVEQLSCVLSRSTAKRVPALFSWESEIVRVSMTLKLFHEMCHVGAILREQRVEEPLKIEGIFSNENWLATQRKDRAFAIPESTKKEPTCFIHTLEKCSVGGASGSLLDSIVAFPPETRQAAESGSRSFHYFVSLSSIASKLLNEVLQVVWENVASKKSYLGAPFKCYNLISDAHGFTFNLGLLRFFTLVCKAFITVHPEATRGRPPQVVLLSRRNVRKGNSWLDGYGAHVSSSP